MSCLFIELIIAANKMETSSLTRHLWHLMMTINLNRSTIKICCTTQTTTEKTHSHILMKIKSSVQTISMSGCVYTTATFVRLAPINELNIQCVYSDHILSLHILLLWYFVTVLSIRVDSIYDYYLDVVFPCRWHDCWSILLTPASFIWGWWWFEFI